MSKKLYAATSMVLDGRKYEAGDPIDPRARESCLVMARRLGQVAEAEEQPAEPKPEPAAKAEPEKPKTSGRR